MVLNFCGSLIIYVSKGVQCIKIYKRVSSWSNIKGASIALCLLPALNFFCFVATTSGGILYLCIYIIVMWTLWILWRQWGTFIWITVLICCIYLILLLQLLILICCCSYLAWLYVCIHCVLFYCMCVLYSIDLCVVRILFVRMLLL